MDQIIPIAILVLFIILTASWLFSRYRMCPPDKILIVFGKVGTGSPPNATTAVPPSCFRSSSPTATWT